MLSIAWFREDSKQRTPLTLRLPVPRKANLEVTVEEKPKTRLRHRKASKGLYREKKPVCTRRKASLACLRRKKASLFRR